MKIGDVLAEIELFAHRTGLFVIVVVHPSKPQKGEQIESLYNASGSAEFRNRADYGLVLVNDDNAPREPGSSVQTIHVTDQLNHFRALPVSNHCWLDRSEQQQLAFEAPDPEDDMPF